MVLQISSTDAIHKYLVFSMYAYQSPDKIETVELFL